MTIENFILLSDKLILTFSIVGRDLTSNNNFCELYICGLCALLEFCTKMSIFILRYTSIAIHLLFYYVSLFSVSFSLIISSIYLILFGLLGNYVRNVGYLQTRQHRFSFKDYISFTITEIDVQCANGWSLMTSYYLHDVALLAASSNSCRQ